MHVVDLLGIPYHAVDGCKTRVPRPWDGDGDVDEAESLAEAKVKAEVAADAKG